MFVFVSHTQSGHDRTPNESYLRPCILNRLFNSPPCQRMIDRVIFLTLRTEKNWNSDRSSWYDAHPVGSAAGAAPTCFMSALPFVNKQLRAEVAQLVEHSPEKAGVDSSILSLGTTFRKVRDCPT